MTPMLFLLLLLFPLLAQAEDPYVSPQSLAVQPVTCVPGPSSLPYVRVLRDTVTFPPGRWLPTTSTHLRCALTERGTGRLNALHMYFKDPDGPGWRSQVLVTLWQQQGAKPPVALGQLDSNTSHSPSAYPGWNVMVAPLTREIFLFSGFVYWVEIQLGRRTATTVAPVVGTVRLLYQQRFSD